MYEHKLGELDGRVLEELKEKPASGAALQGLDSSSLLKHYLSGASQGILQQDSFTQ